MSKPFTKNSHYVPRSYVQRWADSDSKVWAYRTLVSHDKVPPWTKAAISSLTVHQHIYTQATATGVTDAVEHWLNSEFESPAAPAIEKALRNEPLTDHDWTFLIRFLAAQDARTPATMMKALSRWQRTLQPTLQKAMEDGVADWMAAKREGRQPNVKATGKYGYVPGRVTAEAGPDGKGVTFKMTTLAGRSMWLESTRYLLTNTISVLHNHRWTIMRSPQGMEWLTSDDPVVRLNTEKSNGDLFDSGWSTEGGEIFLPLGPEHMLYTRIGMEPPPVGDVVGDDDAAWFQRLTIDHADRFIIAKTPNPEVEVQRPRIVDAERYKSEEAQRERWHQDQLAAEERLRNSGEP